MKTLKLLTGKFLIVALVIGICFSFTLDAGETGLRKRGPRGAMNRPGGPNHMRWFMNLEDVVGERAKHQKAMKEIMSEAPAFIKDTIKKEKEGKKEGEKIDPEAIDEKVQEKLTEVGGKLVDAQIRHQKAMISLLEKHRDDAIENLKAQMKERRIQRSTNRRQNRQDNNSPRGLGRRRSEDFEGSIF